MEGDGNVSDTLKWLARGPRKFVNKYKGYLTNGYRFHTKSMENERTTQNSGVCMEAQTMMRSSSKDANPILQTTTFYGVVEEIITLDYFCMEYTLFKCNWIDVYNKRGIKTDDLGFTMVNMKKFLSQNHWQDDPFILASQAKQVFYVQDPVETDWYVVLTCPPKGLRNNASYEPEYADLSHVVDFQETKCVSEEDIADVDVNVDVNVDYVRSDCEGIWLNLKK